MNTQLINYRKLTNIDHELLSNSIIEINHDNISAIELNDHLSYILNKYAPIRVKCINSRTNKWFNSDTLLAKQK